MDRLQAEHGDAFTLDLGRFGVNVILACPDEVKLVLQGDPGSLQAGEQNAVLAPLVGRRSVLTADGERHLRQRRLLSPRLRGEHTRSFRAEMRMRAEAAVAGWPTDRAFRVAPRMHELTLELIVSLIFGVRAGPRHRALMRLLPALIRATTPVLFIPAVAPLRFTPLRRRVDALIYAEIGERRREADPDRQDILSLLLTVEDDAGQRLDDTELRDELMTLLFAGHETTATALSWAVALLVHHPHTMVALRADLATGNDAYLRAVIRETHRLRPTVPNVVRKASSRVEIGRWTLTPGCVATPAIHLLHRRADCYPQPDRFLPERWLGDSPADGAPWLPFGGGTRRCIGAAFADMEMQEVLKVVIEQVRLVAAARGIDRPRRRTVTTVPGSGVRVLIRNPSA